MAYSDKVIDHYENPRNVGSFGKDEEGVATGMVGAPACGDVMKLQIKVNKDGIIEDARFKTYGCGSASSSAICVFRIDAAWSTVLPFTHSVTSDDEAIAEPQPSVLNFASSMMPSLPTLICSFITSPHAGAPTIPVATPDSSLPKEPTLRGFS